MLANGYRDGIAYLDTHADATISQYREAGRRRADGYVRSDRREAYLEGWLRAGEDYEPDWQAWLDGLFRFFAERHSPIVLHDVTQDALMD